MNYEDIRTAQYYTSMLRSHLSFFEDDSKEALVDRLGAAFGCVSFIRVPLFDFIEARYGLDMDVEDAPEGSYSAKLSEVLSSISMKTWNLRAKWLEQPIEKLKENLTEADNIASSLPYLISALEAGEDDNYVNIKG